VRERWIINRECDFSSCRWDVAVVMRCIDGAAIEYLYIVTNQKTYHFAQDMSWVFHGNERKIERKGVSFMKEESIVCASSSFV